MPTLSLLLILAAAPALPPDVDRLAARRSACRRWAGEEPYDAARGREIARAVRRLRCRQLLIDEHASLRRHRGRLAALAALREMRAPEPDWPGPPLSLDRRRGRGR